MPSNDEETRKRMRPAWEIVLCALHVGQTVQVLGVKNYVMQDGRIYWEMDNEDNLMGSEMSLNGFLAACENIPVNDLLIIGAQTALMKKTQERAAKREKNVRHFKEERDSG